ncbi:MAG TPA: CARDB domain-containing protein [Gaiellaceae bacterium]|nr:CARDB domain-containing protein [Gaiellaceae bacterium]
MSERFSDDDIEFDFFEDVEDTREQSPPDWLDDEPEAPRDQPRAPRRQPGGPGGGLTPRGRLIALVAGAVALAILLVFLILSCTGEGKKGTYENYMEDMRAVANGSDRIGRQLDEALTTPGIRPNELATKLDGLADLQQQELGEAEAVQEPGALGDEHASSLEALSFRVSGMRRLADAFRATAGSDDTSAASLQLAGQANRLVASDVIWADLFRAASLSQMRADGVSGVPVPESDFVQNPEFGSPGYWEPVFERVNGAATDGGTTTGGLHGTGIVETKALPSGVVLSTDVDNIVTAGTDLAFAVTVENTGDNQEVQIKVTLTIEQQPSPIVATKTIDVINPGESKTVTFSDLGQVAFATQTTVKVDVQPVPDEANADNNSAEYPVIFSLG